MTDEPHTRALLTAEGWSVTRASLYDEEGVEGWRWDAPNGHLLDSPVGGEFYAIGSWDEMPEVPDALVDYLGSLELSSGPTEGER